MFSRFVKILMLAASINVCPSIAQTIWRLDQPLARLTINTPDDVASKRSTLSQAIWGATTPQLPAIVSTFPGGGNGGEMAPAYFGRTPTSSIWLAFTMENNVWARTYYATFANSTCLVIVNGGHGEGFFNYQNVPNFNVAGVDALVRQIAVKPCDIILNSMPMMGENRFAAPYIGINPDLNAHDVLAAGFAPPTGSALKYFVGPGLASLSYALAQRSYQTVAAVGLSGGGWATTLMAAIDPRIQRSYAVAGSVPLDFRAALPREGDWEQYALPLDYLDLYAMSVDAADRRSYLFYNGNDPCCFQFDAVIPWAAALTSKLSSFPGCFAVYQLFPSNTHDIQPSMQSFIINDLSQ